MKKTIYQYIPFLIIAAFFAVAPLAHAAVDCDHNTCIYSDISANTTWSTTTAAYVIMNTVGVNNGITLTIDPGVIVKIETNAAVLVNGTINATTGTGAPVYFTSLKDDGVDSHDSGGDGATTGAQGDWQYIKVNSGGSMNVKNSIIRYGGRTGFGLPGANMWNNGGVFSIASSTITQGDIIGLQNDTGITTIATSTVGSTDYGVWVNGGKVSIASTTLDNSTQYGIYATGGTGATLTIANNLFTNNSVGASYVGLANGLLVVNNGGNRAPSGGKRGFITYGDVTTSQTWAKDGMPYIISDVMVVPSGKTLTIAPGAGIKFESTFGGLTVSGALNASGTLDDNIYITSISDDSVFGDTNNDGASSGSPGQWKEIKFNAGSVGNFTYANTYFGGWACCGLSTSNFYNTGGTLTFASSTIASSTVYGIQQTSGSATTTNSRIFGNDYGIYISGGTATTSFSAIKGNTSYGLHNSSGSSINAENNYWGAADGPSGSGPGSGDAVSSNVDYDPWDSAAHFILGYSSVNATTSELRYDIDLTAYAEAWHGAVSTWNALGEIGVATDTASTTVDVFVQDVDRSDLAWDGSYCFDAYYETDPKVLCAGLSVDVIYFNSYFMNSYPSAEREHVAIHELGHALGLGHSFPGNVMFDYTTTQTSLGNQDIDDYQYLYP